MRGGGDTPHPALRATFPLGEGYEQSDKLKFAQEKVYAN